MGRREPITANHAAAPPGGLHGLFLPAILYGESLNTSLREIRANLRVIVLCSVALVVVTQVAADLGVGEGLPRRVQTEYEEHAETLRYEDGPPERQDSADARDLDRRLRLGVLEHKRQTNIALRDANEIHDIVLRELQAAMDLEEVRLLGPAPAD